jgi:hypothetical protein
VKNKTMILKDPSGLNPLANFIPTENLPGKKHNTPQGTGLTCAGAVIVVESYIVDGLLETGIIDEDQHKKAQDKLTKEAEQLLTDVEVLLFTDGGPIL